MFRSVIHASEKDRLNFRIILLNYTIIWLFSMSDFASKALSDIYNGYWDSRIKLRHSVISRFSDFVNVFQSLRSNNVLFNVANESKSKKESGNNVLEERG